MKKTRGITPVIATIILIAGSLVLGLVVGAYTVGLFGANVKTIQLNSATLFGGTLPTSPTCSMSNSAYATIALNNPGAGTNLSSITLTGSSLNTTVTSYYVTNSGVCTQLSSSAEPSIGAGNVTSLTLYFGAATPSFLTVTQTFNYVITFVNGQSISGSLIAQ